MTHIPAVWSGTILQGPTQTRGIARTHPGAAYRETSTSNTYAYCMAAEATQEKGRRGVAEVKRWLEATTFMEFPWNAYEKPAMCTIAHLAGKKVFDLRGQFIGHQSRPVAVENKSYSSEGGQYPQYQEFLATAYSATAKSIQDIGDTEEEFIWVTTHPFKTAKWTSLETHQEVLDALRQFPDYLGETIVDEELARTVAERVWVLVLNQKQSSITLSPKELQQVHTVLMRKETSL